MATMVIFATEFDFNDDGNAFLKLPHYIMFDFFRLALGIADYTRLLQSEHTLLTTTIYIVFVILCNILLFNLLIAAMNKSYGNIGQKEDLHWHRVRLADMIIIEWIAPVCVKKRHRAVYERQNLCISLDTGLKYVYEQHVLEAADCDPSGPA